MSTLKVGTIQDHANSNNALLIDSSGRITAPANPKFSVRLGTTTGNTDYTTPASIPTYDVPLDTEDFDIGGCMSITGSVATFTSPITGYYQFNLTVTFQSAGNSTHVNTFFDVNGTLTSDLADNHYRVITDPEGGGYHTLAQSALINVPAGQTVKPKIYVATDTTVIIRRGSRFQGFLVP